MTAKKRWLNKIYSDSPELKCSQADISWSSSESDEDLNIIPKKKANKCASNISTNKWLTSLNHNGVHKRKFVQRIEVDFIHDSSSKNHQSLKNNNVNNEPINGEIKNLPDVSYCKDKSNEAPNNIQKSMQQHCEYSIMNDVKLEELSPILNSSSNLEINKEESPILISKRRILERIRSRYCKTRTARHIDDSSPDLFETECTQVIDSDSPEIKYVQPLIESDKFQATECIDIFPSQHSSQVINSNTDSDLSKNNDVLYHQPTRKRKHYKKGGLASLLQKALHLQKTRVAIWQHEMYTRKIDNSLNFDEGEIIAFVVKTKWKEYGNTLLECYFHISESKNIKDIHTKNSDCSIVILDSSCNVVCDINCQYKLFPPYSIRTVLHKSREVYCYFNVTKLVPT